MSKDKDISVADKGQDIVSIEIEMLLP